MIPVIEGSAEVEQYFTTTTNVYYALLIHTIMSLANGQWTVSVHAGKR